jgi:hypothetical protein
VGLLATLSIFKYHTWDFRQRCLFSLAECMSSHEGRSKPRAVQTTCCFLDTQILPSPYPKSVQRRSSRRQRRRPRQHQQGRQHFCSPGTSRAKTIAIEIRMLGDLSMSKPPILDAKGCATARLQSTPKDAQRTTKGHLKTRYRGPVCHAYSHWSSIIILHCEARKRRRESVSPTRMASMRLSTG